VQSAPANNGHYGGIDPEINFASIPQNHSLEHPADNSPHMQQDDNGSPAATDGAHLGRGQVDGSESANFADNGSPRATHSTGEDTSVPSTPADNGHHPIDDSDIGVASIPQNDMSEHPADNLPDVPAQANHAAHPTDPPVDPNQSDSFKFADNDSAHPGTVVPHDSPTLTTLSSDSSGAHGPAAPNLNVPGTVMSDAASDKFIFGKSSVHDTVADHKPDVIEIDHTVAADIQHLLDTAHDTNAVSALDPNHGAAPQDMTKVQLPHHQGDFHLA
jgi:hypothetical protein